MLASDAVSAVGRRKEGGKKRLSFGGHEIPESMYRVLLTHYGDITVGHL